MPSMIYATSTGHAIRALSELAARGGGNVMLDELLAGSDLPRMFVAKLFQPLVKAGLLSSIKGRKGGFALARPAHAISLLDIVIVLEGRSLLDGCVVGLPLCNDSALCPQHDLYKPIRQRLTDYLQTTTLADAAASLKSRPAWRGLRGPREQSK
jgi:Rrf2 family protein